MNFFCLEIFQGRLLFRVQFDDQLFIDLFGDIFPFRVGYKSSLHFFGIELQPGITAGIRFAVDAFRNMSHILGSSANGNHVARPKLVRRYVGHDPVDGNMTVADELARAAAGIGNPEAEHGIIQAGFQELEEHSTRDTAFAVGFVEQVAELAFQHTVGIFRLLFFEQLDGIVGTLPAPARVAMHTGRVFLLFEGLAGPENGFTERSRFFRSRTSISCHSDGN